MLRAASGALVSVNHPNAPAERFVWGAAGCPGPAADMVWSRHRSSETAVPEDGPYFRDELLGESAAGGSSQTAIGAATISTQTGRSTALARLQSSTVVYAPELSIPAI